MAALMIIYMFRASESGRGERDGISANQKAWLDACNKVTITEDTKEAGCVNKR